MQKLTVVFVVVLISLIGLSLSASPCKPVSYLSQVGSGLCIWEYGTGLGGLRGIIVDKSNYALVIDENSGTIISMFDVNGDGILQPSTESWKIATQSGLNHALVIEGTYIYASSPSNVYRWKYTPGTRANLGQSETVLKNIPATHHMTRTLIFDTNNTLFVAVGSGSNVDPNPSRAAVIKCSLNFQNIPSGGYDWTACQIWASGTRNEVGLRFDNKGRLWGVENGVDDLARPDLGGDIHQNNPGEEINIFDKPGFYGYPYCWSEGLNGLNNRSLSQGPNAQWVQPEFIGDGVHTDAWCKNTSNVIKPVAVMQAHTAPLDIIFHDTPSFPAPYNSGTFITQKGSWDANPPTGYQVVHYKLDSNGNLLTDSFTTVFVQTAKTSNGYRPVALAMLKPCGPVETCLLVTSENGIIIAVTAA